MDALGEEVLVPGFPARLEGVWSKLRGYLARLSLVLAACRCADGAAQASPSAREERVEREDVEATALLLDYFKAHARRVYAETGSPDPLETLGANLKTLIEDSGGRLEATATDLHRKLEEMGCEALPARPKELGQSIRKLAEQHPSPCEPPSAGAARRRWRGSNSQETASVGLVG